ncbi:hypothetical protein FEZ53_06395 [Staphylococcus xylosus]|uniref:Uncharacterized protein n=1 Tax=Staphylococcus xylosus TaxID=1288 RepID=A0A5R9B8Y4_STAXY|nr:hypothetical protein [Staphylococcus xylosus]TLP91913.1 hypothetical protein FEZ53_06395 [Staphylococcus xylosus]
MWIPIVISSISLIFSIWTFFYNKYRNEFKIDFSVLHTYATVINGSYIKVSIENKSATPISITKFKIANESSNKTTVTNKMQLGVNWFTVTSVMPIHLNPYEACNAIIYFNVDYNFLNNRDYQLHLFTTRGRKSIFVEGKNKTKNSNDLVGYEGEMI